MAEPLATPAQAKAPSAQGNYSVSKGKPSDADEKPVKNLRIRFWGVQGSCPLFPEYYEVEEYNRMIARELIGKILNDLQHHISNGGSCTVEDILGGPVNDTNIAAYQQRLGDSTLPVYGGDTTCISIETPDGDTIVIDGGSGIRNCSKFYTQRWPADKPRQVFIFGTHEHLDHRSGLPFSQFCFLRPPFTLHVYGSAQFLHALDQRYGIFSRQLGPSAHLDDPIDYRVMAANFNGYELRNDNIPDARRAPGPLSWPVLDVNDPIRIHGTTITAFDVYHGATRCLAYKIQHGPATFLFCTDHELRHGKPDDPRQAASLAAEERIRAHCRGVDAAYFDGQYFRDEYNGTKGIGVTMAVSRVDWGHGCVEDVIQRTAETGMKKVFIGHHDPERTWYAKLELGRWIEQQCFGKPYTIELAKSEDVIDL